MILSLRAFLATSETSHIIAAGWVGVKLTYPTGRHASNVLAGLTGKPMSGLRPCRERQERRHGPARGASPGPADPRILGGLVAGGGEGGGEGRVDVAQQLGGAGGARYGTEAAVDDAGVDV